MSTVLPLLSDSPNGSTAVCQRLCQRSYHVHFPEKVLSQVRRSKGSVPFVLHPSGTKMFLSNLRAFLVLLTCPFSCFHQPRSALSRAEEQVGPQISIGLSADGVPRVEVAAGFPRSPIAVSVVDASVPIAAFESFPSPAALVVAGLSESSALAALQVCYSALKTALIFAAAEILQ